METEGRNTSFSIVTKKKQNLVDFMHSCVLQENGDMDEEEKMTLQHNVSQVKIVLKPSNTTYF